jgi:hypothetical protein
MTSRFWIFNDRDAMTTPPLLTLADCDTQQSPRKSDTLRCSSSRIRPSYLNSE